MSILKQTQFALSTWIVCGSVAFGFGDGVASPGAVKPKQGKVLGWFGHRRELPAGTLGYGPPGPQPGDKGFPLRYHVGYGYGMDGLGTEANGGYPTYGGPGYPHPWPKLQRIGGINPFPYFGGPGQPTPNRPHFYGQTGPLAPDNPVVTIDPDIYRDNYGSFTGTMPYPESTFAPYASQGEKPTEGPKSTTPAFPPVLPPPSSN